VPSTRDRTALYGIVAAIFVSGTGIGSVLPVLPLYLRDRGESYAMVGVIVGAPLVAQALGQWPAGRLTERVGRREMMVIGLIVAGIASVAFAFPLPVGWLVVLRFAQGLGFAAAMPAEMAAVADVVPPAQLGRAYAWVSGAQQLGFIGGPAIGGLLAVSGRSTVFAVTGAALFLSAIVVGVTLRRSVHAPAAPAGIGLDLFGRSRAAAGVRAVAILSIGLGLLIGIYDVIWSLYMRQLGASDPVIGASFTLFALPLLIATPFAGWGSDRFDRRWLAAGSILLGSLIGPFYPLITSVAIVLIVGAVEGATWAFTAPAMNSFLMDAVAERRAEAQGVVGTAMSAATAAGSLLGGWLFTFGTPVPFDVAAAGGIVFSLLAIPGLRALGKRAPAADDVSPEPGLERSQGHERGGRAGSG
jgi:MFS family permease